MTMFSFFSSANKNLSLFLHRLTMEKSGRPKPWRHLIMSLSLACPFNLNDYNITFENLNLKRLRVFTLNAPSDLTLEEKQHFIQCSQFEVAPFFRQ